MAKNEKPGHYTAHGTKKHQCNGPVAWGSVFRKAAGDGQEGDGVRAALAYAVGHPDAFVAWSKAHPDAWARATTAPTKAPKASKPAKGSGKPATRTKAPKASKAGGKAPKALKPGQLAKVSKALGQLAEQAALPGVK